MTLLDIIRDPVTGHYDLHLRLTEVEALDLASRIIKCAEAIRPTAPSNNDEEPTP